MYTPKFSVVTVSYNHEEFIRSAIDSVLEQNYPNFEHIIVDGGSTDGTKQILEQYPHLIWTSESDRGQSHALNKGFKKASGDIIAWLNSDDWYAPNIFSEVASRLREHPILLGSCELVDRHGKLIESVPNIERNWFDILKYWIYYSSPAQPSIFFTKELLEKVRLENGDYIDENLDFCMDYDLWLRMSKFAPLSKRIPKIFSYYRTYETNKTGQNMAAVYREMSRAYKRHANHACNAERQFTAIVPLNKSTTSLNQTIESLTRQTLADWDLVLLDYSCDRQTSKLIRNEALELSERVKPMGARYLRADTTNLFDALNYGISSACSQYTVILPEGAKLSPNFCAHHQKLFQHDNIGIAIPSQGKSHLSEHYTRVENGGPKFNLDSIFSAPWMLTPFIARTITLKELNGFMSYQGVVPSVLALPQLLLRALYKGWQIYVDPETAIDANWTIDPNEKNILETFRPFICAKLVADLGNEQLSDPFSKVRTQHGFSLSFSQESINRAMEILNTAPANWLDQKTFLSGQSKNDQYLHNHP